MLTMSPGALQGQRSVGPPKVVGELLKGAATREGSTGSATARRRGVAEQVSGMPAAAAMVLAKDMATGRKSLATAVLPQSPRAAARASGILVRPKPVTPSASRKTTADAGGGGRKQRPNKTCCRPTSAEHVKVYVIHMYYINVFVSQIWTIL